MINMIRMILLVAFVLGLSFSISANDDKKWIDQCIADNKDEKQSKDVIKKYCTCMVNEMDDNENSSVSKWEKTPNGKVAEKKCDKESGWKK